VIKIGFKSNKINGNINFAIIFLIMVFSGFDLIFRSKEIAVYGAKEWGFYALSICFLILLAREYFYWQKRSGHRLISALVVLPLTLFIVLGSYAFYNYFSILPNVFTFEYMYEEYRDFIFILKTNLTLVNVTGFVLAVTAVQLLSNYLVKKVQFPKRNKIEITISVLVVVGLSLMFNNNVRLNPGAFSPLVNTFFSFTKSTASKLSGKNTGIRLLTQANRIKLVPIDRKLPFNVLIVINESLRALNSGTHGYSRNTTPNISRFLAENEGVALKNYYANCTRTGLAIPTIFTGINPVQSGSLIFSYPIYSNYAKTFKNVKTFVISAHSYKWFNFDKFLNDGSWDSFMYKETSPYPEKNALCYDDKYLAPALNDYLQTVADSSSFVGLLHLNGTHDPYYSDDDMKKFNSGDRYDVYDNAVLTVDKNINEVINTLKKHNRLNNTVIIFTSDHAEALGEHGYSGHLHTFYEEEARLPGWIYIPQQLRKSPEWQNRYLNIVANRNLNMSNNDLMPTFLELLGIWNDPTYATLQEKFLGNPLSLPLDSNRIIRFQNYNDVSTKNMFTGLGLKYKQYKYLLHTKYNKLVEEVYDVRSDSLEKNNLIKSLDPAILNKFHQALQEYDNTDILYEQLKKQ